MTAPRANIYAVAERAGVSIATVSRVQRGVGPVSTETRERVEQAIDELGYSPDPTGRALAGQRLDAMGIVFPDLAGPYYSSVLLGAEAASVAAGSSLLILATHGRPRAEELARELSARVDGLIVMGRTISDEAVRALGARVPLVLLARTPIDDLPTVRSANREPAAELVEHLLVTHGHERLSFIGDPALRRTPKTAGRGSWTRIAPWVCRHRPPPSRPRSMNTGAGRRRAPHLTRHRGRPRSCAPPTRWRWAPIKPSATGACAPGPRSP